MKSGKMRHVIRLQEAGTTLTPAGTPVQTWTTIATLRAELVQQSAQEFLNAQGATGEALAVFRIRTLSVVLLSWRLLLGAEAFNIRDVVVIERGRGLELRCTRVTGGD